MNTQPGALFAKDIWKLVEFYIEKTLRSKDKMESKDYTKKVWQKVVPKSCLIKELYDKFITLPTLAFTKEGDPI